MKKVLMLVAAAMCMTGCAAQADAMLISGSLGSAALPVLIGLVAGYAYARWYKKQKKG